MIVGHTSIEGTAGFPATADSIFASRFAFQDCLVSKVTAYLDGNGGAGTGQQTLRAVIYDADGNLVATSQEVAVANLAEPAWVDFTFSDPVELVEATYALGLHCGPISEVAQIYGVGDGTNAALVSDSYSNGAGATGFAPTWDAGELAIFATFAYAWSAPDETDLYFANLGYWSAQATLGSVDADPRTKKRVYATWHGTFLDPEPQGASLAVVQSGGDLTDLVGERLRITSAGRSTVVYVHRETDLDLDDDTQISLSRRAWQALARLGDDTLLVTTEVIPAEEE